MGYRDASTGRLVLEAEDAETVLRYVEAAFMASESNARQLRDGGLIPEGANVQSVAYNRKPRRTVGLRSESTNRK